MSFSQDKRHFWRKIKHGVVVGKEEDGRTVANVKTGENTKGEDERGK